MPMDMIYDSWLARQHEDALALNAASDAVQLAFEPGRHPPQRFIARFDSPTMVQEREAITRTQGFAVLFQFPPDYLRSASEAAQIVALLAPQNIFHPNVMPPFICTGRIVPGTALIELVYRVFEILTWQKVTPREDDALNRDACAWARRNMHLIPLSKAPLRRREVTFAVDEIAHPEALQARHA